MINLRSNKKLQDKFIAYQQRALSLQGFMSTKVAEKYERLQRKRWITENVSEGSQWQPLNPKYAAYKRKRWMNAPGGGRHILVASGDLYKGMISGYRKIATDRKLIISTNIEYARHVDEARTFSKWGRESIGEFRTMIYDFVVKNKLRPF